MPFDFDKVESLYPQAGNLMWEPMLMWKAPAGKEQQIKELCEQGKYFASIKKDGACYQAVRTPDYVYLFGRTISKKTGLLTEKIDNVPHIKQVLEKLPANTVIVFEIYYPGKESRDVTSIMGCLPEEAIKRQEHSPIHAYAHDILYYDGIDLREAPAIKRYLILNAIWKKHGLNQYDFMELAQPIYEDILNTAAKVLAAGEEGLVLRDKNGPWVCGKRPSWNTLKIKKANTVDLVCIGFCDATKVYTGKELDTWPYWEYTDEEGNVYSTASGPKATTENWIPVTKPYFLGWKTAMRIGAYNDQGELVELGTVSSGLTDSDKEAMTKDPESYLNRVVELSCMELIKDSCTLRHPAFVRIRDDKNPKDCLISEVFK